MAETKEELSREMEKALEGGGGPKAARFALACLGGIPGVGGAFSATASAWSDAQQKKFNKIFASWLKLQEEEIKEIGITLMEVMLRLDPNDHKVEERVQSREYLSLVKKCFRDWSAAESEEKRILLRNLLANAASCAVTTDDVIRLFIEWINKYSEAHFKVVACVHGETGITRKGMWDKIHGAHVREDSAEADLFKLIIDDLSIGHIIRQHRKVDRWGNFLKKTPSKSTTPSRGTITSAFDDKKPYELTELGRQFVHYAMSDIVPKITDGKNDRPA
jgi:hypothetical protein